MAIEEKTGDFLNTSTALIQDVHNEYDVELIEIGLLSDSQFKVVIKGEKANINQLLTVVDDPRNPPDPEEPEEPEEPIDP